MRQWVFRIVTVIAVPVLFFVGIEAGLRLAGYGQAGTLTVPCRLAERSAFCDNDRFTWPFFPPGAFRLPLTFAFPAEKAPGTYRIFVIGESAAQGDPEPAYSFSRYLEVMLRARFPQLRFEVVNAGITAVNSHVLLPAVRDLARRQGDLFIVYMGNNEVVGPYGAGNPLTPRGTSLALIRAGVLVRTTRLGQLLGNALRWGGDGRSAWHGMEMFLKQQVPADAPALAQVYANFEANLEDILAIARTSGAHVLVSTVGANLKDSAPFASAHRADLAPEALAEWEAKVKEGAAREAAGKPAEALESYLAAAKIDDRHAELQFRIGRAEWALDDFAAARQRLSLARDLDVLRFRADSRINDIIREVGADAGSQVELIDGEALLAGASAHEVPGREVFYDHVHLKPLGNYTLARALYQRVVAQLPEEVRRASAAAEPPPQAEAERLLALTPFDQSRVLQTVVSWLGQPPFTNQLNHDEAVRALTREAQTGGNPGEIDAQYRWAIDKAPDDHWLHAGYGFFLTQADPAAAIGEFHKVLTLLPGHYGARQMLADTLVRMGKFGESVAECRTLLAAKPYHAPAYMTMAYALMQLRSHDESIAAYERAMALNPGYAAVAHNTIGLIELHQKKYERAIASFEKALELSTDNAGRENVQYNLEVARRQMRQGGTPASSPDVTTSATQAGAPGGAKP